MKLDCPAPGQTPALRALWKEAFGDSDDFLDSFFTAAFSPDRCRCAAVGDSIAAALYWFGGSCEGQKVAYLYAVATGEAFRGRGLCRALLEDTHALLARQGYSGSIVLPAGDSLRQMYRRFGYRTCSTVREFTCAAGTDSVPIRPIDRQEYTLLRRNYLPKGGVLQENENLTFLETQAKFYAGTDFLLAAQREGTDLEGLELLGSCASAPEILCALDCSRGSFRTPGEGRPFAMFRPLTPDARTPDYFGLAFD